MASSSVYWKHTYSLMPLHAGANTTRLTCLPSTVKACSLRALRCASTSVVSSNSLPVLRSMRSAASSPRLSSRTTVP